MIGRICCSLFWVLFLCVCVWWDIICLVVEKTFPILYCIILLPRASNRGLFFHLPCFFFPGIF